MTRIVRAAPAAGLSADSAEYPRRWSALAVLCISLLIVTLDNTVLNVVLPTLVRQLHATTSQLQWIVDAYVMVFAGLLLLAGSLADRVGRKRTFLAGLVVFAAGSTWAAFSGSVGHLIAARASMGIGAALIMPSTLSIITSMFRDPGERQRAIGLWAATSGAGIALGPIIGGVLLAHFWWGSVFLINLPIAAVGLGCAVPLVPNSRNAHATTPDLVGAVLSIAGLGLVLWSIIEAPVNGWSSALVIGTGLGGLAVLAGFAAWERASSHPMLNVSFFRRRQFSAAVGSVGLLTFGLFGALFVLTQLLQFSIGYTPLQCGFRVLPAAGAIAVVAPLSASLVRLVGTKITAAAGMLIAAGGLWQLSVTSVTTSYPGLLPGMVMLGVGAGLVIPSATASVMGSVPADHTGVGSATNGAFLQIGGALGVAVIGSLLSTRYQDHLRAVLAPYHVPHAALNAIQGSLGGALAVATRAGGMIGEELAQFARSAFVSGMDLALSVGAAVTIGGVLIVLALLPSRPAPPAGDGTFGPEPGHLRPWPGSWPPDSGDDGFFGIRFESIGGLGAHLAGRILAEAGVLHQGLNGAHFSSYGSEKKGTPVKSFVRFCPGEREVRTSSPIERPQVVAVFHEALARSFDVAAGLSATGTLIMNTRSDPEQVREALGLRSGTVEVLDALGIAIEEKTRVNTAMLGAVVRACPFIDPGAVKDSIRTSFSARYAHLIEANLRTFDRGYRELRCMTWSAAPGDPGRPVQRAAPAFGYLDAPIGGTILDAGNSIVKNLSTSRQGFVPAYDPDTCAHCGICDIVCPDLCFVWTSDSDGEPAVRLLGIDYNYCKGCMKCVDACPTGSLTEIREEDGWAQAHRVPLFAGSERERGNAR